MWQMPPNNTFFSENMSRSANQEILPLHEIMTDTIVLATPESDVPYPDLAQLSSHNHFPSNTFLSGSPIQTCEFYVYGFVHRWYILPTVQRDATQSSLFIILQVHSTCIWCQPHPLRVHKTVTTASGTRHIFCAATYLQRGQVWPRWR